MKYLSRNKIYEKVDLQKDAKKIYIFCEGEKREIHYFKYFQGISSNIDIIPIPNENGSSDPVKLKENANSIFYGDDLKNKFILSEEYEDEVWFAIDTDDWNNGNKIESLREYCIEKNKKFKCWYVSQSNPSFEIWLYYHFHSTIPNSSEVEKYETFKKFVNEKIPGGFDSRSMPIEIEKAIINSEKNFIIQNNQPKPFTTEMHLLGKKILPFIKDQIDKIINS